MTPSLLRSFYRPVLLPLSAERIFLLLAVILLACPALHALGDERDPSIMRFRYEKGFAAIVPVSINGSGPYDFLLDTGASYTSIDNELARDLGLSTHGEASVTTLVHRIPVSFARAHDIRFGPIAGLDVEVLVRDLDGLRNLDPRIRGVLGQNMLDGADYLIDYKKRSIQFDADGDLFRSLHAERTPLTRIPVPGDAAHGNLAVRIRLNDGMNRETRLLIDSGSASLVVFSNAEDIRRQRLDLPTPHYVVQDAAGEKKSVELRNVQLGVGDEQLNVTADVVDFGQVAEDVGGLLPTNMFVRVYISNSRGFALFDPKVDRRHPLYSQAGHTAGAVGGR